MEFTAAPRKAIDYKDVVRPRAGTWLDTRAKQLGRVLADEYRLVGFDEDLSYLMMVEELRGVRQNIADALHITAQSAQRYINDETIRDRAAAIAAALGDEIIDDDDPFMDDDTTLMAVEVWARAAWSFQLVALAVKPFSASYAWSMVEIATSMTAVLVGNHVVDINSVAVFFAPRAGAAYVARALDAAREQVTVWDCPVNGLETWQLVDGLESDAQRMRCALAHHSGANRH